MNQHTTKPYGKNHNHHSRRHHDRKHHQRNNQIHDQQHQHHLVVVDIISDNMILNISSLILFSNKNYSKKINSTYSKQLSHIMK